MWGFSGIPISIALSLYFSINYVENAALKAKYSFSLNILHTNDMHSRFEQTSAMSYTCTQKDETAQKCYGGFARVMTIVREARNSSKPTLFLNAGDTYQGNSLFTMNKWKIVAKFLNLLSPDAISLGNHEFDDGPMGLAPFLKNVTFPVLTANIDTTEEPKLANTSLVNSKIFNMNGTRVGVIGYLTPETKELSRTGKVRFIPEIEAIRKEITAMQSAGVKILIALGHSGYDMDKKIAEEVDGIDLVIGGHSNTFLYTEKHPGEHPDREVPVGDYPTVVQQKNGRKVYVVQAYAYTKYIGNLTIDFDEEGEIKHIEGRPILLDSSIVQAPDVLDELKKWKSAIPESMKTVVGSTKITIEGGDICKQQGCDLGNLVNDAIIDYNRKLFSHPKFWTDAAISIYHGGAMRTPINVGEITMANIMEAVPFQHVVMKVQVNGSTFRQVLEKSVESFKANEKADLKGGFLQFSGVNVTYDLSRPVGSRVSKLLVRCANCEKPTFSDLVDKDMYTILLPDYLKDGGDGYWHFKNLTASNMGITLNQVLAEYIKNNSPLNPLVDARIKFVNKKQ